MDFHDTRETRDPEARERELLARLPAQIAHARAAAPALGRLLADVDPDSVGVPAPRSKGMLCRAQSRCNSSSKLSFR